MSTIRTGTGDCERCHDGAVAQPVNAVSSLGFVVAGALSLRSGHATRPIEQVVAWSAIVAGLGSVAFHGPGGRSGKLVHDSGLIALLGSVAVADFSRCADVELGWGVAGAVGIGALGVAGSRWNEAAQLAAGVAASLGEVLRITRSGPPSTVEDHLIAPLALSGGAAHLLGRTDGPLCAPDSLVQPHAYWHLATAAVVWLRNRGIERRERAPRDVPPNVVGAR